MRILPLYAVHYEWRCAQTRSCTNYTVYVKMTAPLNNIPYLQSAPF